MSTRSAIIAPLLDHSGYVGIYCHSDGYPAWVGNILHHRVTTHLDALKIIWLGDLSSIHADATVDAYHRDGGDKYEDVSPITGDTIEEVAEQIGHDHHVYAWQDGGWTHNGKPIAEVLRQPEIVAAIASLHSTNYPELPPPFGKPPARIIHREQALRLCANL